MRLATLCLLSCTLLSFVHVAQAGTAEVDDSAPGTVSGLVIDAGDGQPLPGATVQIQGSDRGAATDAVGRFVLRGVPAGSVTLRISYVGYLTAEETVEVADDQTVSLRIELEANAEQLAEVMVRSDKFVRNLQETQASANVLDAEQLEALAIRDWNEAASLVGNFSVNGLGGFVIRGINNTGVGFAGVGTTSQLYIDGVAQNITSTRTGSRGLWDVEAVEIFRGPQSTTAGRNALAGAVSIRSADPTFTYGAAVRAVAGNLATREGAVMVTGPLVADQLAFRLSGEYQFTDTDFTYSELEPLEFEDFARVTENEYSNLRARLLFTPKALPGFSARLGYTFAYDRPNILQDATGPDFEARSSTFPLALLDENRTHNGSLELRLDVSPTLTLTSLSGLLVNNREFDGLLYQVPDPSVIKPISNNSLSDDFDLTQELRLNLDTRRATAVFGVYAGRFTTVNNRRDRGDIFNIVQPTLEQLFGPQEPFEVLYDATLRFESESVNLAAFGEANVELVSERLTLTAGLRYDSETYDAENITDPTFAIPNSPLVPVLTDIVLGQLEAGVDTTLRNPDATYNALLPKVGLTYDLTRDVSIGATVQRGYRAGGAEILGDGSTNVYDPEYTWNYEASFRSRWLNGRLTANANFFYTDWTDQQVRLFREGTTLTFTANAGASTLYGAELELRAIPARGLTVFSSAGLVETEFDEFVIGERDLAGFEFPNAVGETVSVGATYESAQGFFGGFSAGYTGTYFDDVNTLEGGGNDPLREAGGYTLVNARIGYLVDVSNTSARIALWSRNLLDETVELRRGFNALDQPTVRFGLPRVVGVSVELEL